MKKRSKFTIQPKYIIFFLTLFCIGCMITSVAVPNFSMPFKNVASYVVVPLETGMNHIGKWFAEASDNFESIDKLQKENLELNSKVAELQEENNIMAQDNYELARLRELYELDRKYNEYPKVAARVIGKDTSNWFNIFTIDKGSDAGVKKDMNVIAGGGLVGIVTDVGKNYAKIRAVIDDESSVSVSFASTSDTGIVSGDLKLIDDGLLNITGIQKEAAVTEGDMVVTSQISDKFLPGILVGYVQEISLDPNELTQSGKISPVVDFQHIDEVLIIMQLKEKTEN